MFPPIKELKCVSCSVAVLQKLSFSVSCQFSQDKPNIYKPHVLDTKARSSSKIRKPNLSKNLRAEFTKHKGETPLISCKRKEFNFFKGMKYGKFETVPLASMGWNNRGSNGDFFSLYENHMPSNNLHFDNIRSRKLKDSEMNFIIPQRQEEEDLEPKFSLLGIGPQLSDALQRLGFHKPADVQVAAIPHILQGKNCVVSAHTGCGKTLAYLLPLIQNTLENVTKGKESSSPFNSPMTLILTPSRELAYQIHNVVHKLLEGLPLTSKLWVGGSLDNSIQKINEEPQVIDILIGSLGTSKKKFESGDFKTERIKYVVLDEADQLADDFNYPIVKNILRKIPIRQSPEDTSKAQINLVSATAPVNLERLFETMLPVDSLEKISTTHLHDVLKNVPQLFLKVGKIYKGKTLIDLVEKDHKLKRPVVIFSNKIKTADWVSLQLNDLGFPCRNLTSNVPARIRNDLFEKFQAGEFDILSTTPMTARGLDTVRVQHIINFEFPLYVSEYIHQIGRVGRIGSSNSCHITNIISHQREVELVQKIELSVRLGEKLTAVNANIPGILRHRHEKVSMS